MSEELEKDVDVVPRIRRSKGLRLNSRDVYRIVAVAILLVCILLMQRQCADGVAGFVTSFDASDAGVGAAPDADPVLGELKMLTPEEIKAAFDDEGGEKLLGREIDAGQ